MYKSICAQYNDAHQVSVQRHSLQPYASRLQTELKDNKYAVHAVLPMLQTQQTYTGFATNSVELRVIGDITPGEELKCERICRRVKCIQQILGTRPTTLVIWVFLTNALRKMPKSGVMKPEHINGGYTYVQGNEIFVLRREEFPKVVLHEVLHHTPIHIHQWGPTDLKALYSRFGISKDQCDNSMSRCTTDLAPNEAIIEAWAEVLHLMFLSRDYGVPWNALYEREKMHAINQTRKVLTYKNKHFKNSWTEETHVFSYIVIRSMLFINFQRLCSYKIPYNASEITTLIMDLATTLEQVSPTVAKGAGSSSLRMTCFGDF